MVYAVYTGSKARVHNRMTIDNFASIDQEICVSIDLETTGLVADNDQIIEIGAVKFQGELKLDTFHSMVNPYRPLPRFIMELTGISQAEVEEGAPFTTVAPQLQSFIGNYPLVGQNIDFDLGFLAKNGLSLSNPYYDTREMASILLPRAREYSLLPLAASLGIEHPRLHRALEDAEVTAKVFHALNGVALNMDAGLLFELGRLHALAQKHLARLFQRLYETKSQLNIHTDRVTPYLESEATGERLGTAADTHVRMETPTVDEEAVNSFFNEEGPLSQVIEHYRYRPQQAEMARAVVQALNGRRNLVVEGGTGVGKSMAYLFPSLLFALENRARVVVSTNTINLQEQLMAKDLPALSSALEKWYPSLTDIRFSILKGRDNYLCLRRWNSLQKEQTLSQDEARIASKIMVWLRETSSGDRSEMNLASRDMKTWSKMSSAGSSECPPWGTSACFLRTAREQAEGADLVVVNHALLMRDLIDGGGIIPAYDYLVIDEAHHLEAEATNQLGSKLSRNATDEYIERSEGSNGVYSKLRILMSQLLSAAKATSLEALVHEGEALVVRTKEHTNSLWNTIESFVENHHEANGARQFLCSVTRSSRTQPEWSQVEVAWENADMTMSQISINLERLEQALGNTEDSPMIEHHSVVIELSSCLNTIGDIRQKLRAFIMQPQDDQIYWITQESRYAEVALNSAPLHVGETLQKRLFSHKNSVILTSATLTTQGNFQHISERLGLEDANELVVDSPFDYPKAVLLCIPTDMPNPTSSGYQQSLQQAIIDLCKAAGGRTMGLFTSHAALQNTRAGIREDLNRLGFKVLAQGVDGPPRALLDSFMENPEAVLLGTSSFWEGVDIPGGALKALVVARLPFNVPTDPVFTARSQLFEDPFNQYAVPQSVLRFRQGFGRLIRGELDKGVAVVLDQRILSRPYGKVFLESIPKCTVLKVPLRELPYALEKWLSSTN